LMVLVLHGGAVHQQMFNLSDPFTQTQLSEIAGRINTLCMDLNSNQVRLKSVQLQMLEREIADTIAELMEKADSNPMRLIYREGLSEVISSFHNNEGAQQAVRVFEERAFLNMILNDLTPIINHVQVLIGGDGRWNELKHISIVFSRYGIPGQVSGAVGVLGPISINYGRAISTVRYVSGLMTDALEHVYETPENQRAENQGKSS
jgi:heat-inducible transcriptional repressor